MVVGMVEGRVRVLVDGEGVGAPKPVREGRCCSPIGGGGGGYA
jgi:hypothetical protein